MAVTPMHVRGNINDGNEQKVLARALVNEENAGVRLQTVNAIASHAPEQKNLDPEVKTALISALKGDQNPGVRQEALRCFCGKRSTMKSSKRWSTLWRMIKIQECALRRSTGWLGERERASPRSGRSYDLQTKNRFRQK